MRNQFVNFDGNEKSVLKMTVLILAVYQPVLLKQINVATMDCETENKESKELFQKTWNKVMQKVEFEFNPIRIILEEKSLQLERNKKNILERHYVKSVRIWSFSGPYFPAFGLNTERYGAFSPNAGKYEPEKLQIRTLFSQ